MANQEQLEILKQGIEVWNEWTEKNSNIRIDLREADLRGFNLSNAYLVKANLVRANLSNTNLTNANLWRAELRAADLIEAILIEADLVEVDFTKANVNKAYLNEANLTLADFSKANLSEANFKGAFLTRAIFDETYMNCINLSGAHLNKAIFNEINLTGSNFTNAEINGTFFGNLDLSNTVGLGDAIHRGPSSVAGTTFTRSRGKIPAVFLQGCGLSDWEIESSMLYNPELSNEEINKILYRMYDLRASQAIQISPLFISYSHRDSAFVDKLEGYLNKLGVRFWRDIQNATAGRLEKQIDQAIRSNPTVLLILSEHSIKSDWVEHEVRTARELEKEMGRDILCPVALDGSWKNSPWPQRVMEQVVEYNILDFSEWKDDKKFGSTFNKLIDGLGLFYKSN